MSRRSSAAERGIRNAQVRGSNPRAGSKGIRADCEAERQCGSTNERWSSLLGVY
jgi:hypothetical protein